MWKLKEPPKILQVTNTLAETWAKMEPVGQDRPLNPTRVNHYESQFKDGMMRPVEWAKVHVRETQKEYRVNGKHTSTMFSSINLAEYPKAVAVISTYECETLAEAAQLYSTFDSRMQIRKFSDVNRAYASLVPELDGLDFRAVDMMVSAMHYVVDPSHSNLRITQDVKADRLLHNVAWCEWLTTILGRHYRRGEGNSVAMWRMPVVAAMFSTWNKAKTAATEFWTAVRDDTGATPNVPDRVLGKYLSNHYSVLAGNKGQSQVSKKFRVDSKEFYVRCLKAWNMWRTGETGKITYRVHDKIPTVK